ncbi:MAG: ABC transporter ATP-binding protein [Firmicutes bacterium]|nr:ABC transporter ATP-binding protein [Bacillota bacterium]
MLGEGSILAVLGPSGSGKTTLLQLVAGLLVPTEGEVRLGARTLSRAGWAVAPEKRNVGLVFQDFALWPHMTVAETIAFPLAMRRLGARARAARVEELLALVRLEGLGQRYPHELSGGQRQRVAIARALAARPGVVLLDEPMPNLDAQLRERMRLEIADTLRREGVTAVYVTHDRLEALSVADRVAILDGGALVQAGEPQELYRRPATAFVATFLGPAALVPARVVAADHTQGVVRIVTAVGVETEAYAPHDACRLDAQGFWLLRPEHLALGDGGEGGGGRLAWLARVDRCDYAGSHWQVAVRSPACPEVAVVVHHPRRVAPGSAVWLTADPSEAWFVPVPAGEVGKAGGDASESWADETAGSVRRGGAAPAGRT